MPYSKVERGAEKPGANLRNLTAQPKDRIDRDWQDVQDIFLKTVNRET